MNTAPVVDLGARSPRVGAPWSDATRATPVRTRRPAVF